MKSRRSSLPSLPTGQATIAGGTAREAMTSLSDPTPNLPYSLSFSNWIEFSTVMLVNIKLTKYSTYCQYITFACFCVTGQFHWPTVCLVRQAGVSLH